MKRVVSTYLSQIGRKGGLKSRRSLSPVDAMRMVRVREARKLYRRFHARCFWSCAPDFRPGLHDVEWVAEKLRAHGGADGWREAARLCR